LFRPYQRDDAATPQPAAPEPAVQARPNPAGPAKKTVPTPTRRSAEQARRDRLHPVLTKKQANAQDRQARMTQRQEQTRVLDSQPGKVLARDFIDSKRHVAQFAMPLIFVCLAISFAGAYIAPTIMNILSYLTWLVILAVAIDLVVSWRKFRALHTKRLPDEPLKGLRTYFLNRSINPRRMRMPAPRVKLGDEI